MPRWLIRILSLLTRAWDHFFAPPRPPIVYLDGDGVGWRKRPEWQDASSPDEGQHDWAKRQMRIFLWRAHQHLQREATTDVCIESGVESIDMRVLGLGDRRETAPQLWPVGLQLAEISRRLGFVPLALASGHGLDLDLSALQRIHARHEEEVAREAQRRKDANDATAKNWNAARMGYSHTADPPEHTLATLTLGPFDARPAGAAELQDITLNAEATPVPAYTRSRAR